MTHAVRRRATGSDMNSPTAEPQLQQDESASAFPPVPQQQEMPLAIVRGEPVLQMPQDL